MNADVEFRTSDMIPNHIEFKCPHMGYWQVLPLNNTDGWQITSLSPLTVIPSIDIECEAHCHGFITDGKWVPA